MHISTITRSWCSSRMRRRLRSQLIRLTIGTRLCRLVLRMSEQCQRLMDKIFMNQFRRNLEVCVNDMVVKNTSTTSHAKDLVEIFAEIRKYNIRLNPEKCIFVVHGGKFLGFVLSDKGIEANLEGFNTWKEVQRLIGWFVALSRLHCQFNRLQAIIIVFCIYTYLVFSLSTMTFEQIFYNSKLQFLFLEAFKGKVNCKHFWDQDRFIQSSLLFLHLNVKVVSLIDFISYGLYILLLHAHEFLQHAKIGVSSLKLRVGFS